MSYRISHQAVSFVAARDYGIMGPVFLVRVKRRLQANGMYSVRAGTNAFAQTWLHHESGADYVYHRIRVEGGRPAAEVAESIAHELEHCRQAEEVMQTTPEADVIPPVQRYLNPKNIPYEDRPVEVLAREAGRKYGRLVESECFT